MLKVLLFLLWGNFLPPVARLLCGHRWEAPLDFHWRLPDGQPLFGSHKTIRGGAAVLVGGTAFFPLLGVSWQAAAAASLLIVAGDLLSSLIKRRLALPSGASVPVLDQLFEGLLPTLFLAPRLALTAAQVLGIMLGFVLLAYAGSLLWEFMLARPAAARAEPRLVRSRQRFKAWRACHPPLARYQLWLNFENYFYYRFLMAWVFKGLGLYDQGMANSFDIRLEERSFWFPDLPQAFDGFRVLLLTDLHLDGLAGLTETVIAKVKGLEADVCLIGGDIRMEVYGPIAPAIRRLRRLVGHLPGTEGSIGVLGNHDCIEMVPELEDAGLRMLINDAFGLEREGERIWVAGIDDPHYYKVHDLEMAFRGVPKDGFALLLAHSPEAYQEAARAGARLYLCGHTHGGQICGRGGVPLFTHSRAPRRLAAGRWRHQDMQGYTSRGTGPSGLPLRFNCPGEITLITLRRLTGKGENAA